MKQTCFKTVILIAFLCHCISSTPPPNSTPATWTESLYTSTCSAIGTPKIAQNQNTAVELSSTYSYLTSNHAYTYFQDGDGNDVYSQLIYKYYIRMEDGGDGFFYLLQISLISSADGSKRTQTKTIPNSHEFISASGQYCLLKQGNNLVLYAFDFTSGVTDLVLVSTTDVSTYTNEIFKSISLITPSEANDNLQSDVNYAGIVGILVSIDTTAGQTIVRKILSTGIDAVIYRFTMNNANNHVYNNLLLGLQISGSNFYTFVCPQYNTASPPYVYASDATAIDTSSGLYSNHIVITFLQSMMIATYDDTAQNGNIFFLISDASTYQLSLVNMKTTLAETAGNLHYLTDYTSYIIELNVNPAVSSFYIVWSDDQGMYNYTFLNQLGDQNNAQIIQDFSNQQKISSLVYAQYLADSSYESNLYLWIIASNKIVKYDLQETEDDQGTLLDITINKQFSVDLVDNLLVNSVGLNFQVTTQLKCQCQVAEVTDMICFYGTDACTFTVQTSPQYCTPQMP